MKGERTRTSRSAEEKNKNEGKVKEKSKQAHGSGDPFRKITDIVLYVYIPKIFPLLSCQV